MIGAPHEPKLNSHLAEVGYPKELKSDTD